MRVLDGKVAVITGASGGSGRAVAARFAAEGASVVMLARGRDRLEHLAKELDATAIVTDVADPDSVGAAFAEITDRFAKVDILINHAAVYRPCAVDQLSDADIHQQVATNFLGPVHTCRAAIPLMREAGGGDIVNTSSESTLHPFPRLSLYVATKAALEAFGRVLAMEVRDDNIRVTTVVQGAAVPQPEGGSTDWAWDPDHGASALALWGELGLMNEAYGRHGGQDVAAIADVHLYIVTRPRTQTLEMMHCRSF